MAERIPNNKYKGSPAFMNDGRTFTDYRPNVLINEELSEKTLGHHHDDYIYRKYLTNNGKNLTETNYQKALRNTQIQNRYDKPDVKKTDLKSAFLDLVARPKNLLN